MHLGELRLGGLHRRARELGVGDRVVGFLLADRARLGERLQARDLAVGLRQLRLRARDLGLGAAACAASGFGSITNSGCPAFTGAPSW